MSQPKPIAVHDLVAGVQALLESGQTDQVSEYLSTAPVQPESLAPYLHRSNQHYTRNLIFKSELFEMLALCWGIGHRSWIHNHRGQRCWMAVVSGGLMARNYQRLGCHQQSRTVRLEPLVAFLISPGSAAQVDPAEPVHLVWNPQEFNQPAVSIHVYSRPFDHCVVYEAEEGLCREVRLFCTSQYGVVTEQHKGGGQLADLPLGACHLSVKDREAHCGAIPQSNKKGHS